MFIETEAGVATPGSIGLLAKARALAGAAAAVVCGPDAERVAATLDRYGADQVWFCDMDALDPELAGPHVDVIAHLLEEHGRERCCSRRLSSRWTSRPAWRRASTLA